MSAVRMVAYGVLEMKPKDRTELFLAGDDLEYQQVKKNDAERDQLRKLVNDELKRYGMLLMRRAVSTRGAVAWRTSHSEHILYGQRLGQKGFAAREILCEGTFRECCIMAAGVLDGLDRAQVPDTAAG